MMIVRTAGEIEKFEPSKLKSKICIFQSALHLNKISISVFRSNKNRSNCISKNFSNYKSHEIEVKISRGLNANATLFFSMQHIAKDFSSVQYYKIIGCVKSLHIFHLNVRL